MSFDLQALESMDYLHLGRLVALTILQGGPGLPLFDTPIANYILSGQTLNLKHTDFPPGKDALVKQVSIVLHNFNDVYSDFRSVTALEGQKIKTILGPKIGS